MKQKQKLWVGLLCCSVMGSAASLRSDTGQAWNGYLQRVHPESSTGPNVPLGGSSARSETTWHGLQQGRILVRPAAKPNPLPVPSGIIHDWIGQVLFPRTTLDRVLKVVLDHNRYREFYAPLIVESKTLSRSADQTEFSLVMQNRSLFSKAAVATRYTEQVLRLDPNRAQIITQSSSIQEIENYGSTTPRVLSPDESSGYLWRIYSVAQYQQRSEGVVLQLEMIVLSRDVPPALRWIVDPLIRHVAESTLQTSLERTRQAVENQNGEETL